jgi:hypothetical protein
MLHLLLSQREVDYYVDFGDVDCACDVEDLADVDAEPGFPTHSCQSLEARIFQPSQLSSEGRASIKNEKLPASVVRPV